MLLVRVKLDTTQRSSPSVVERDGYCAASHVSEAVGESKAVVAGVGGESRRCLDRLQGCEDRAMAMRAFVRETAHVRGGSMPKHGNCRPHAFFLFRLCFVLFRLVLFFLFCCSPRLYSWGGHEG